MSAVRTGHPGLRPMTEADLLNIQPIEQASYDYPWSMGNFIDSLREGYSMWVREAGVEGARDAVIGYYVLMAAAGEAHLLNLTVAPEWRRHGLGRELLAHCMARACAHDADQLFLEVRTSNRAAIHLYRSHGFADLAVRRGYYPAREGREDALILKKDLTC
jgi:ribosomal-protein-alanine N-acetyltransferase